MYQINNQINSTEYKGLQVTKLSNEDEREVLFISLEKDKIFKKHISPGNARLIMLEGCIKFHINQNEYLLRKYQTFNFPKYEVHWVEAQKNSSFLIIR